MVAKAAGKFLRGSARKARLVLDLIRGKDVQEAEAILDACNKGAARLIKKILHSAVSNAVHNRGYTREDLYVSSAVADQGPVMKRFRAVAFGRAVMIRKKTSHIIIELDEKTSQG